MQAVLVPQWTYAWSPYDEHGWEQQGWDQQAWYGDQPPWTQDSGYAQQGGDTTSPKEEETSPKGKGNSRKGKGKGRRRDNSDEFDEKAPMFSRPKHFVGEWQDSLGNAVKVSQGAERRGPLAVKLSRGGNEHTLSLRYDTNYGCWACGNALLDFESSTEKCAIWVDFGNGRRSVWTRNGGEGDAGVALPDLFPWLLVNPSPAQSSSPSNKSASKAVDNSAEADGARVAAILDIRQVLGADRVAQETLSCILMDHDLVKKIGDDPIVPPLDSPLWERLKEKQRRNALTRLASFSTSDLCGSPISFTSSNLEEVHVGRHRFEVSDEDVQALLRRWRGEGENAQKHAAMAHVFALYQALESPLTEVGRSPLQLSSWDETARKKSPITHELFASPFNAHVSNGNYSSRFPHVEKQFGSVGSYPDAIDLFPKGATVGVHPSFSDAYLEHVMGKALDQMLARFGKIHLTVPVREAPWRSRLQYLQGCTFARSFYDATARTNISCAQTVVLWQGSELRGAAKPAASAAKPAAAAAKPPAAAPKPAAAAPKPASASPKSSSKKSPKGKKK